MVLMGQIWKWLTTSNSRSLRKAHPDLCPIDVAKLTKELNLLQEAKRYGESGLPTQDATTLAGVEALVVQRVEKARHDYMDWAVLRLQIINQDLSKRDVTHSINLALQADKEFERRAGAILTDKENLLRKLGNNALNRRKEVEEFKAINRITRDAHPPKFGTYLSIVLPVAVVVIEALINSQFFAQGLSSGLIGGFTYAATLAGLNVATAFLFGKYLLPQIYHRSTFRKVVGVISFLISICLMVVVGLGIAHMRDALTSEAGDALKTALETLRANPLGLLDIMSWVLFGISVLFATLALVDGFFSDDIYPGYGKISRRSDDAVDEYENELSELRQELEILKNDKLKSLEEDVNESKSTIAMIESYICDKKTTNSRLAHALRDAENSLDALLQTFRIENEMHRGGLPRPSYFNTRPELKPLPLPNFDTSADELLLEEQRKQVDTLIREMKRLRASIQESFNRQFNSLMPLDIHFSKKKNS